jgi:hypothetical protein
MLNQKNQNEFYVYCYMDPRKPGKYSYDGLDICFLWEPFYIGKGKGRRIKKGLYCKDNSNIKKNKINKIKEVYYTKLYDNISQEEALSIEEEIINKIKVFWQGGPLVNVEIKSFGNKINDYMRKKMSENHADVSGDKNPMYGKQHTEETKELIRKTKNIKKILQYDTDGNFIREWNGYSEIYKETGIRKENLSKCCNNKKSSNTIGGYYWMFKQLDKIEIKINSIKKLKKDILQYDLQGNFIREWNSIKEACDSVNLKSLTNALDGTKDNLGGYMWRYKTDNFKTKIDPSKLLRIVQRLNNFGEVIEDLFLYEAGQKYGGVTNIINCCDGRTNTCKGYKWRFKL